MDSKLIMILIAMIGYLAMIVTVGLVFSKKNKTSEEFYLGGRELGPWITAMSAEASDMSSWLLMGLPGLAYAVGIADAGWTAIGLALGTYLNWRFIAKPLRYYTEIAQNAITVPDYFSNRFHDEKKILMNLAAIFILLFFVVYTASGFVACGKLFESLFGFNYQAAMVFSAFVIIIYTAVGGFLAESTVDFIQGILMIVALGVILVVGAITAGGVGDILKTASESPGYLSMVATFSQEKGETAFGAISIASALAWGLGYVGMPHILLRFMAIRDGKELKKSRIIGTSWCVISLFLAVTMGVVGKVLYPTLLTGTDTERIFIIMCRELMSGGILPIIGGIMLCGILAAQISTSDSQLLMASASVSQNFYKGLLKKDASEKEVMWVARFAIILVAIASALLALNPTSSIFKIVSFAWAGFGACFGPLIIFSLYWKRTNFYGALAGMLSGGATVIVWKLWLSQLGGVFKVYELLPAFIISSICIVVVSLLTKPPVEAVVTEFERYKEALKTN